MKKNIGLLILFTFFNFGLLQPGSGSFSNIPMSADEVRAAGLNFYDVEASTIENISRQFPKSSSEDIKKIFTSIERYALKTKGTCPCPWNKAKNDSGCGKRSAYYRSGGHEPFCYSLK